MLFRILTLSALSLALEANIMVHDINISGLRMSDQIEKITYSNHKSSFRRIEKQKTISFIPENDPYILLDKEPKILHNAYGTMYLYDLTKKGKFLNAYVFDQLEIDANLSGVTVGLADGLHAEKEYHLQLKNQPHIDLRKLYKKIDLSHLKYFIVIDKSNKGFHLKKLSFFSHKVSDRNATKDISSWLWKAKNLDMQKIRDHNIHRLYVQMNQKDFPDMLKKLSSDPISIYGLNGSPADINNYQHLLKDIDLLANLKKKYPFIKGYQIDVEPYLLPNFNQKKDLFFKKYMKMIKNLTDYAHKKGLKFSVVIPFWFDSVFVDNKNLGFYVCDTADEIVLMSYRSDLEQVLSISRLLLSYAGYAGKDVRIGIELMKIEDERHQIYEVVDTKIDCLTSEAFSSKCVALKQLKDYVIRGDSISFHGQTDKLKSLYEKGVPYPAFKGYVLHHLEILPKTSFIQREEN